MPDKAAFGKLHALHEASNDPEMGTYILREEIMDLLTGVGRILQYFVPTEGKLDKSTPRQLWSMYEGQIKGGIASGFARIIYGETGKSYMGFYKDGQKRGKGIQRFPDGSIQAQGIWSGNETIAKGTETMVIDDFSAPFNVESAILFSRGANIFIPQEDMDEDDEMEVWRRQTIAELANNPEARLLL